MPMGPYMVSRQPPSPVPSGSVPPSHRAFVPLPQWVKFLPASGLHASCPLSWECSVPALTLAPSETQITAQN